MPTPRIVPAALALLVASAGGAGEDPLPYTLAVHVEYDPGSGPAAVREEAERALLEEFAGKGCFERVVRVREDESPGGDLLVRVVLGDLREETDYETSLATQASPDVDPSVKQRMIGVFSVRVLTELRVLPEDAPIRSKRFLTEARRRPWFPGEDVRAFVRAEALARLAERARKLACGGSREKLRRRIEASRASTVENGARTR